MSYTEGEPFWPLTPEYPSSRDFKDAIRTSLNRLETPAPMADQSKEAECTERGDYGRLYMPDGTVAFGRNEEARQLQIGDLHVLALAYNRPFDKYCAIIYRYKDDGELLIRSMIENYDRHTYKEWLLELSGEWGRHPSALNSRRFRRRLESNGNRGELGPTVDAITAAIDRPNDEELPRMLDELLVASANEEKLIKINMRERKQMALRGGRKIVNILNPLITNTEKEGGETSPDEANIYGYGGTSEDPASSYEQRNS